MILPHKMPLPKEEEGYPSLPRAVMQSMLSVFAGFFIPLLPQAWSLVLGLRIIKAVRTEPDRYTGRVYGYFAIVFAVLQTAGWIYVALSLWGVMPPPAR